LGGGVWACVRARVWERVCVRVRVRVCDGVGWWCVCVCVCLRVDKLFRRLEKGASEALQEVLACALRCVYVSIRQHTSAYVSTSAEVLACALRCVVCVSIRQY